jgi:cytochrome c-type biogenesis protein CcmH
MTIWFLFALMSAAAIFAVLWPLGQRKSARAGSDVAVYRDQLEEIERDRAAGLIAEAEAEAARVEVSRRLIAAADKQEAASAASGAGTTLRRRAVTIAAFLVPSIGALSLYLAFGSPTQPGQPYAARREAPQENRSFASLLAQVESHLERNPNDGRGWEVVAPVYLRLGRFDDAVKARRNALAFNSVTAEREADLGEALLAQANGIVTAEAKAAFERALALDGRAFKARFFIGLAAEQDGKREEAAAIWRDMLASAPPDAPWADFVRSALARADGTLDVAAQRGPSAEDMAAAAQLSEEQRGEMIRGMVARLAERLKADGSDVDGWLRLVRAYMVLGDREKARSAAADARRALASDPEKVRRVDETVKGLGIEG